MLTLYSYPPLFGVADNNGYGLKVYAFLKLAGVPFRHEHIFDASKAPRGQLPHIVDGDDSVGDSETNIYFYDIDTPPKQFVAAQDNLVRHCRAIHAAVSP